MKVKKIIGEIANYLELGNYKIEGKKNLLKSF